MIKQGDCKTELKKIESNSIDLIYLDPPFFTQKKQSQKTRDNSKEYTFDDSWESIESYKTYIEERLFGCKRVLKNTGSIFLHCDRSASHHLRIVLDNVFGANNFQSEIVWIYKRWSNAKKGLLNAHQVIYFYSKTADFKFNHIFEDYSPTTNIDQIFQKRTRDANGKTKYKTNAVGGYELIQDKKGVPLSDVWDIPYLNPKANERVGYPTQKPIVLLEKVIQLVTDEGDMVLDPFCGSGTTLVAAKLLNRKFIGIDISDDAVQLAHKRVNNPIRTDSYLLKNGKSSYLNQDPEILQILKVIDATPVQRNKGIDGFLRVGNSAKPIPVKIQRDDETIEKAKRLLLQATSKNGFKQKVLIKTNNTSESTLFKVSDDNLQTSLLIIDNLKEFIKNKKSIIAYGQ
ncbi:site-specific DNA-methyltransferase [Candidatus Parcubacteria bacterium]|nr:site-specific DNA-methyltransferase [Patescibacteria group bacterium]MCG2689233.1 site-specific DNA-methyltransferase [Candidatus Parcubacteria bacterium]